MVLEKVQLKCSVREKEDDRRLRSEPTLEERKSSHFHSAGDVNIYTCLQEVLTHVMIEVLDEEYLLLKLLRIFSEGVEVLSA